MGVRYLDVSAVLNLAPRRRPGPPALTLRLASEHMTLRDVIARAVEVEVRRAEAGSEMLVALLGGGAAPAMAGPLRSDLAAVTERALEGLRDGSYRVMLDGRPVTGLDEPLSLGLGSRVAFLRVVPLVSG